MTSWIRPPGPVARGLRVGLLGGSFNPAHAGHRYVAEVARRRLGLDYVWWLVAPQNPLKADGDTAPLEQRLMGVRVLIGGDRRQIATDIERLLGTRYTIDTLQALIRRFPEIRFIWLMGSDNLEQFHRWHRWAEIVALVPIAVVLRPGSTMAPLKAKASRRFRRRRDPWRPPVIVALDGRRNETSATAIRAGIVVRAPDMLDFAWH